MPASYRSGAKEPSAPGSGGCLTLSLLPSLELSLHFVANAHGSGSASACALLMQRLSFAAHNAERVCWPLLADPSSLPLPPVRPPEPPSSHPHSPSGSLTSQARGGDGSSSSASSPRLRTSSHDEVRPPPTSPTPLAPPLGRPQLLPLAWADSPRPHKVIARAGGGAPLAEAGHAAAAAVAAAAVQTAQLRAPMLFPPLPAGGDVTAPPADEMVLPPEDGSREGSSPLDGPEALSASAVSLPSDDAPQPHMSEDGESADCVGDGAPWADARSLVIEPATTNGSTGAGTGAFTGAPLAVLPASAAPTDPTDHGDPGETLGEDGSAYAPQWEWVRLGVLTAEQAAAAAEEEEGGKRPAPPTPPKSAPSAHHAKALSPRAAALQEVADEAHLVDLPTSMGEPSGAGMMKKSAPSWTPVSLDEFGPSAGRPMSPSSGMGHMKTSAPSWTPVSLDGWALCWRPMSPSSGKGHMKTSAPSWTPVSLEDSMGGTRGRPHRRAA